MAQPKFRHSTLEERRKFYEKEFSVEKVRSFFRKNKMPLPQICALDAGTDTGIIKEKKWKNKMFYFLFKDLKEKIREYCPEDVYFDRSVYKNPRKTLRTLKFTGYVEQELAFDIDIDNIKRVQMNNTRDYRRTIMKAYRYAKKLKKELEKEFKRVIIVYSGRGFHVEVLDKKAFELNNLERERIAERFSKYPIDTWVSRGYIRLMRLPYSLNGLVSRIAIPLGKVDKFNSKKTIPRFLKGEN